MDRVGHFLVYKFNPEQSLQLPTMNIATRSHAPRLLRLRPSARLLSPRQGQQQRASSSAADSKPQTDNRNAADEPDPASMQGAMSRRLEQATEDALLTGGTAGRRAVEDAGFSDELKERLLNKIADAEFRAKHAGALHEAGIPSAASSSSSAVAAGGTPWTGEEAPEAAVRRMLEDARKPLSPGLRGKPRHQDVVVDMRMRREPGRTAGQKFEAARDKAATYAATAGAAAAAAAAAGARSEEEREKFRSELQERFSPGFRAMPNSLSGMAALANERIENAIARGQFKNIPRGKGVESRDGRADNPFIDTTEYIMNNMIKRQDMVPPWIEKQQELARTARVFRQRLRNDWRRHAARTIASRGGSLAEQMARAEAYARAEMVKNPRRRNVDQMSVSTSSTDDPVMVAMRQAQAQLKEELKEELKDAPPQMAQQAIDGQTGEQGSDVKPEPLVLFRDPTWEATEKSYMELSVANLNAITRSYNLMAPDLAKKPYFSLQRELDSCFADVAPSLANTIKERARDPARHADSSGAMPRKGVLDRLGAADWTTTSKIYDSKTPNYGLKEMWRDFWARGT
ncbi:hypothetical protein MGG_08932 [Pyricularia oryzae 70-15]|uniref:DnaJ homologue subfamily C member 28 conserved domain-containing protein n=2 Tax=Pyricularia oryzae TaxID=318829 RepID=G4MW02_PYRO7|nr:uncharacterized protein MGG_08932 [Pyricularia oryzae 70-15]EHA54155.1 hypothetical protein MGG_08932 [Pyricularia oryzae 70-15]